MKRDELIARWSDIDRAITTTLRRRSLIGKGRTALAGVDPISSMYGCGYWGCAYPTNARGWALKITADPNEGPTVYHVMKRRALREHDGNAYILGVWRLSGTDSFVVLREDITPVRGVFESDTALVAAASLDRARKSAALLNRAIYTDSDTTRPELEWLDNIERVARLQTTRALAEFMYTFYESLGFALADIHYGNVGVRASSPKQWVAYDLGHSKIDDVPPIKVINPMPMI